MIAEGMPKTLESRKNNPNQITMKVEVVIVIEGGEIRIKKITIKP